MPLLAQPLLAIAIPAMGLAIAALLIPRITELTVEASTPVEVTTLLHIPTSQVRGFVRDSREEVPISPLMETEDLVADRLVAMNMALVAGATPVAVEMTHQPTEELVPTIQVVTNPTVLILLVV